VKQNLILECSGCKLNAFSPGFTHLFSREWRSEYFEKKHFGKQLVPTKKKCSHGGIMIFCPEFGSGVDLKLIPKATVVSSTKIRAKFWLDVQLQP
jgi:hypothetical protein